MTWLVAEGEMEDGSSAIVFADERYHEPSTRGNRPVLLIVEVFGTYMMSSVSRRDDFLESMQPLLDAHHGVHVAGITRSGLSYRFMFYLAESVKRSDVNLPDEVAGKTLVATALDPDWMEYSSFVPARTYVLRRARRWVTSLLKGRPKPERRLINQVNGDSALLDVLASASDVSKETDIVFYLYVPEKENAYACYVALWSEGYRARIGSPAGTLSDGRIDTRWSVISHLHAAPSPDRIAKAAALMERLSAKFGGAYDGWEAAVVSRPKTENADICRRFQNGGR